MDEFDDGVIGRPDRPAETDPRPAGTELGEVIQVADSDGLVRMVFGNGEVQHVEISDHAYDQPGRLTAAVVEATNALIQRMNQFHDLATADFESMFTQVSAQSKAAQKQFDEVLGQIDQVQQNMASQIAGLHNTRINNQPPN